jgi:hypothetical protein
MAAGRLDVLLGLDAAEFTSGLSKADYEAQAFARSMADLGGKIGTALAGAFTAAVAGATYLTKSAIDAADHLNDLSKATGVSVENLGGIGFAASQAGADLDGVAASFGKLNLKIAEAARGEKEAAEAFKLLGVSIKDASGATRSADAVFTDLANAFAGFEDGPEKAALAMAVFGKSYASILPLLNDGGKALQDNIAYYKQFGGITTETALAADQFNDTLGKIALVTGQLGNALARELLPTLQVVADELLRAGEGTTFFQSIANGAKVALQAILVLAANVKFVFEGMGREIGAVAAQMVALANLDFKGFTAISDAVKEDGKRARKELDELEKRIMGLASGPSLASVAGTMNPDRQLERLTQSRRAAPGLGGGSGGGKPVKEQIDEGTQAYARYVEELSKSVDKGIEYTNVQKATLAIEQNRFGTLIPQQKELLLLLAQQADAADEYAAKIKHNAELERQANAEALKREDLIETRTGRKALKEETRLLEIFGEELNAGRISIIEYDLATHDIFRKQTEQIKETNDAAQELGLTFASALGEWIKNPTSGKSFFKALTEDLLQLTTQMLIIKPLTESLSGIFKDWGIGSGSGSVFGSGSGGGGLFETLFGGMVGSFASGTSYVPRDGLAMVHRGERIVTATDNKRGYGSGVSVQNTFVLPPGGYTRETQNQVASTAALAMSRASRRFN